MTHTGAAWMMCWSTKQRMKSVGFRDVTSHLAFYKIKYKEQVKKINWTRLDDLTQTLGKSTVPEAHARRNDLFHLLKSSNGWLT